MFQKNVPPYSIFVGNKVVRKRFPDEVVKELEKIDLKKICIEKYKDICDVEITTDNIEEFLKRLEA